MLLPAVQHTILLVSHLHRKGVVLHCSCVHVQSGQSHHIQALLHPECICGCCSVNGAVSRGAGIHCLIRQCTMISAKCMQCEWQQGRLYQGLEGESPSNITPVSKHFTFADAPSELKHSGQL